MRLNVNSCLFWQTIVIIVGSLSGIGLALTSIDQQSLRQDRSTWTDKILEKSRVDHLSIVATRSEKMPFVVNFRAFDKEYKLNLQKSTTRVLAENFQVDGKILDKAEVDRIENSIFVDYDSHAVVQVVDAIGDGKARAGDSTSNYEIRGWVDGIGIQIENGVQMATRSRSKLAKKAAPQPQQNSSLQLNPFHPWCGVRPWDYKPTHSRRRDIFTTRRRPQNQGAPGKFKRPGKRPANRPIRAGIPNSGQVEVMLLLDDLVEDDIKDKNMKIQDYVAILLNAVNLPYRTLSKPSLTIRGVGVRSLADKEENTVFSDRNIHKVLRRLSTLVLNNKTKDLTPSDVVALLSGRPDVDETQGNDNDDSAAGLAFVGSACNHLEVEKTKKKKAGVAVARDAGGVFEGIITLAHELGHTLGSKHDFDIKDAPAKCYPKLRDPNSFVMGYGSKTPNAYIFSSCSQKAIRAYLSKPKSKRSASGWCVFEKTTNESLPSNKEYPGDVTSIDDQCQQEVSKLDNVKERTPVTETVTPSCLVYRCPFEAKDGGKKNVHLRVVDGTPCVLKNKYGSCSKAGKCVQPSSVNPTKQPDSLTDQCSDAAKSKNLQALKVTDDYVDDCTKFTCQVKNSSGRKYKLTFNGRQYDEGTKCTLGYETGVCVAAICQSKKPSKVVT